MKYKVTGYLKTDINTDNVDYDTKSFDDYNEASDYYAQTIGDVSKDLVYNGGEFVIILHSESDSGLITKTHKRHLVTTTHLL